MKTSSIVTLAAVGVVGYFLWKSLSTSASSDITTTTTTPVTDVTAASTPQSFGSIRTDRKTGEQKVQTYTFSTTTEGVRQLNQAVARGERISSTGSTVARFNPSQTVSVKLPSGKTETYKGGTISTLGTGKQVYLGVRSIA